MTPNEITLSFMLWLCVGFLFGYRYHVKEARDDRARAARKERDEAVDKAVDQLLAMVAVRCAERPTDSRVN